MGGDRGYAQGPDGVPPLDDTAEHGDDGEMRGRQRMLVHSGRGGYGRHGDPPHQGVHQEGAYDHRGEGSLQTRI